MNSKPLIGTDYIVYEDGRVYNTVTERFVKPYKYKGDYPSVNIKFNTATYERVRLNYVVANAYFPLIEEDGEVIHLDYDINNCHVNNLQWVSFESNVALDIQDNNFLILEINTKGQLVELYRGLRHANIKTNLTPDEISDSMNRLVYYGDYIYYPLNQITVVDVNTSYMIFNYRERLCILNYDRIMMYKLVKLLKDG